MNSSYLYILNKFRNLNTKLGGNKKSVNAPAYQFSGQAASDHIKHLILSGKSLMVARFGSVEMECLTIGYLKNKNSIIANSFEYIKSKINHFWWTDEIIRQMHNNAGFFPPTTNNLERFSELMLNDLKELDVLGSWLENEKYFEKELKATTKIPLQDLEPYFHAQPWTQALKGKKVLVIHPYSSSICNQYKKRELLFKNKDILPEFELITMRSVQSIAGSDTNYKNWFEALDHMKTQIDRTDFDFAIIGCGAYGFPLAAHIKRKGKQAIHLGGATQILFGIKGKRWEEIEFFKNLFNEHWAKPLEEETPVNSKNVENGCYW
ncbi:MAG: hypothetical protein ABIP51_09975 [Bacteroidia bacterium]